MESYPHYRRNFAAMVGDFVGFGVGFAFHNPSTVLPAFVSQLTSSAPLIGLISTLMMGAWLLPQLIAANYIAGRRRQKPYLVIPGIFGRGTFFLLAGAAYFWARSHPALTLVVLYLCITVFMACDAVTSVAWFDLWAKLIPPQRRGRLVGAGQVLSGVMTIGAAEVVRVILSPTGPAFPDNYALLFLLAGVAMMVSLASLASLREPTGPAEGRRMPWREYLPQLGRVWRGDPNFRMLSMVRLLSGLGGLAAPFYIVHATVALGMATEAIGLFITGQTVGSIAAGFLLGYANERWGSRVVIQASRVMGLLQPMLALAFIALSGSAGMVSPLAYAAVFLLMGLVNNSMMPGFLSYLVDMAPEAQRPLYIGLSNSLTGLLLVVPLIGGWLLDATSYPVLFAATAIGSALGLLASLRLDDIRPRPARP